FDELDLAHCILGHLLRMPLKTLMDAGRHEHCTKNGQEYSGMSKQPDSKIAHARKQPVRSRVAAREFSAGGLVVKQRDGKWWMAVIEPAGRRGGRRKSSPERDGSGRAVLALPKGNIDAGETPEQAAVREVREETGLEADVLTKLGDSKYVYVRAWGDGARVFKVVSFYLLRYRSGRLGNLPA